MERVQLMWLLCLVSAPLGAESVASVDAAGFAPFRGLDSDDNGYVSRVEARIATGLHDVFDSADANDDGLLDRKEYSSARAVEEER
ncbi:MAG: hypothetical protein JSU62_00740 [Gammaproteobacteria bacterium]|nr:MAG: hypothetical protein JSU62_00740 [Gammaproteobacteria bacterium]